MWACTLQMRVQYKMCTYKRSSCAVGMRGLRDSVHLWRGCKGTKPASPAEQYAMQVRQACPVGTHLLGGQLIPDLTVVSLHIHIILQLFRDANLAMSCASCLLSCLAQLQDVGSSPRFDSVVFTGASLDIHKSARWSWGGGSTCLLFSMEE